MSSSPPLAAPLGLKEDREIPPAPVSTPSINTAAVNKASAIPSRLDFIDMLRAFACLGVIMAHSVEQYPGNFMVSTPVFKWFYLFCKLGVLGVPLFLVLSGFCLYFPLVRKAPVHAVQLDIKRFAQRRAMRILPTYYIVVLLYTGFQLYKDLRHIPVITKGEVPAPPLWIDFLTHVFMVHNLYPGTFSTIPAMWSLALEFQLYILFPLLVLIAARKGLKTMLGVTLVVSLVWQAFAFAHFGPTHNFSPLKMTAYAAVPARCFEFSIGMVAAALVARPDSRQYRVAAWLIGLLALPVLCYFCYFSLSGPLFEQMVALICAGGIILFSRVPHKSFEDNKALKLLKNIGAVSYSIYLIHLPIIANSGPQHFHFVKDEATFVAFLFLRIPFILAIGALFYFCFEKPFLELRDARKGATARPAAG